MTTYRDLARTQLRIDEGWKAKPYRCTAGKLTVGCGRNLDDVGLRDSEIAFLLENDIDQAEQDVRALVPAFDSLSDVRKAALVNLSFNLGKTRLSGFVRMLAAVNRQDFEAAADEFRDSKWYGQVGQRGVRLEKAMRDG